MALSTMRPFLFIFHTVSCYTTKWCTINIDHPDSKLRQIPPQIDLEPLNIPSMESLMIKTGFLLLFLVSAFICGIWLLKKIQEMNRKGSRQQPEKSIIILEKAYLSSKTILWHATIDSAPFVIVENQHGISVSQIQKSSIEKTDREKSEPQL